MYQTLESGSSSAYSIWKKFKLKSISEYKYVTYVDFSEYKENNEANPFIECNILKYFYPSTN